MRDPATPSGFDDLLGVHVEVADADRAVAVLPVTGALLQPAGILHGGVFATLVESVASLGAYAWLRSADAGGAAELAWPVGISNHTEFLRPAREGDRLRAEATPVHRGRSSQLWAVTVTGADGRLCARGSVRLFNLRPSPQDQS